MTDIFLSYAHEDHDRVLPLVKELQDNGWSVWWDEQIQTGTSFDMEIESVLASARCVLVVWSRTSIDSQWVRSEAHEGLDRNILVPVLIDDVRPPMPFRQIQARELFNLPGDATLLGSGLLDDIQRAFEGNSDPFHHLPRAPTRIGINKLPDRWRLVLMLLLVSIFVIVLKSELEPPESVDDRTNQDPPVANLALREIVVVAQMENLSGEDIFNESLDHAFRIGLGQSRIASVMSDVEIQDVLKRMKLATDTDISREIALEVALRERAKAVILPSINRVGDTYVVSVEIVNPANGQTIFSDTEESAERTQVISALGQLIVSVRELLGESLSSIYDSNLPLEKVTTANLEALKAYSTALNTATQDEQGDPIQLLLWAVDRDPQFAMAHAKLAAAYSTADNGYKNAQKHWALALQYSDRLSERERVYIQASSSWNLPPADRVRAWKLMASLFPGEVVGHHNLAMVYWEDQNRLVEAADAMRQAASIHHPWQFVSMYTLGYMLLGQGKVEESLHWIEASFAAEGNPLDYGMVDVFLALGRIDDALAHLNLGPGDQPSEETLQRDRKYVGLMLSIGQLEESTSFVRRRIKFARELRLFATEQRYAAALLAILEQSGDAVVFESHLQTMVDDLLPMLEQDLWDLRFSPVSTLAMLGKIAARNGQVEIATKILTRIQSRAQQSGFFFQQAYTNLLEAELALAEGNPERAVTQIKTILETGSLFQAHETLARAYEAQNKHELAIVEYLWLIQHHGQALTENMSSSYGREFNLLDRIFAYYHLASLYDSIGNEEMAVSYYQVFIGQWKQSNFPHRALIRAKNRLNSSGVNLTDAQEDRAVSGL